MINVSLLQVDSFITVLCLSVRNGCRVCSLLIRTVENKELSDSLSNDYRRQIVTTKPQNNFGRTPFLPLPVKYMGTTGFDNGQKMEKAPPLLRQGANVHYCAIFLT